jgi:hypothetical protein
MRHNIGGKSHFYGKNNLIIIAWKLEITIFTSGSTI